MISRQSLCWIRATVETLTEALIPIAPAPQRAAALRERVLQHTCTPQPGTQPELLTIRAQEGWKTIAPGVEMKDLYIDDASHTRSFLMRMQPGSNLPGHEHAGDEECMVLDGEVSLCDSEWRLNEPACGLRDLVSPAWGNTLALNIYYGERTR